MLSLTTIAKALGGKIYGREVRAPGPGHSAKDASLCVTINDAGDDIIVFSHAGDDAIACKDYVRERVGLPSWQPKKRTHGARGRRGNGRSIDDEIDAISAAKPEISQSTWICDYDYTDLDGNLLYQVQRFANPKKFMQRRPNGKGGWIYVKVFEGVSRVPYRWPELAEALATYPDAPIFITEGEKDADNVRALGLIATTCAGNVITKEIADIFRDRDVFILEDNDSKGREKSNHAARALIGSAKTVRIAGFVDLPDKSDVSDWIALDPTNHDAEALFERCRHAPEFDPNIKSETDSNAQHTIHATPYVWKDPTTLPTRDWLYGKLFIREYVTATVSPSGFGKSSTAIGDALACVSGKALLGIKPRGQLRVWYWNLEDPQHETDRKVQAAALRYNLKSEDIEGRLFTDSGRDQPLVIATVTKDGVKIIRPVIDDLVAELIERKIDILIIDPFVSCHEVSENDNAMQDRIIKEWGTLSGRAKCAVHLLDHTRKMGGEEVTAESARGASSKINGCREVRVVNRMSKDEAAKAGIEHPRFYFRTYNDKPNLAPPAETSDWFHLAGIYLGNGPDGGDHVGVVEPWQWPDPLAGITGADFDKVVVAIRSGKWRKDPQAKDWVGKPVAKALGLNTRNKADKAKIRGLVGVWLAAGSLVEVEGQDTQRRPRTFIEVAATEDEV
jgi:hypothetical protein